MSDINFKGDEVCYANGLHHVVSGFLDDDLLQHCLTFDDFQLNDLREGDFIPASELDNEQKYNEVVEVFGLFGIDGGFNKEGGKYNSFKTTSEYHLESKGVIHEVGGNLCFGLVSKDFDYFCKRQLTYSQIIAIGKLKRMMLDRENSSEFIKITDQPKFESITIGAGLDKTTVTVNHSESPKTSLDYLTECVEVQKQRGEQYDSTGTGERSFDAAAKAYNALTGGNLKGSDVCLILTCVKAVRQYSNPKRLHEDSLLDLVSYASLWAEELNKELK